MWFLNVEYFERNKNLQMFFGSVALRRFADKDFRTPNKLLVFSYFFQVVGLQYSLVWRMK